MLGESNSPSIVGRGVGGEGLTIRFRVVLSRRSQSRPAPHFDSASRGIRRFEAPYILRRVGSDPFAYPVVVLPLINDLFHRPRQPVSTSNKQSLLCKFQSGARGGTLPWPDDGFVTAPKRLGQTHWLACVVLAQIDAFRLSGFTLILGHHSPL